jgi:hypothetical protein
MHEAPEYAGADYIGVKRTGASELVGVAETPLAAGFFGLAALLAALIWAWAREGGGTRG